METNIFDKIINYSSFAINKEIFLFLFILIKHIIIKNKSKPKIEDKLNEWIKYFNDNYIKEEKKFINKEYTKENFKNILNFIKNQNRIYAGDILEGILIYIFSLAFKADKDYTFGKYLYNNISKFKDETNFDLEKFFLKEKFIPNELHNIIQLLAIDTSFEDEENNFISEKQENSVLYCLLAELLKTKYNYIWNEINNNKTMKYINKGDYNKNMAKKIYNSLKENSTTVLDKDITSNSLMNFVYDLYFSRDFGKIKNVPIKIVRAFFISVFIYYQNQNSPLMKYIVSNQNNENEEELAIIPFAYELKGACIEGRFANIILSPVRFEPRISEIIFDRNNLREIGLYELGKVLLFNKNVKNVDFNTSLIRNNFLEYLNLGMGIHENDTLEELNLSYNYLKENCEDEIAKVISHFTGLKVLNLNSNEFKRGLSSFFVVLKKLYRKGKSKLETLYLNKCFLDDESIYELGELLKCKYCKLKKLYLSMNSFPINDNFLKKIKKNKSLSHIFLSKDEIDNKDFDDILRIISNTEIKCLYIYKTKITDFNAFLEILYRTKLIKESNDIKIIFGEESLLSNLDLSNQDFFIKNAHHIELLTKIIKETTLNCLDISHFLYGPSPDKMPKTERNKNYITKVEELKNYLEKEKNNYIKTIKELRTNEVDIKRNKYIEKEKIFNDLDNQISEILKNEKAKYHIFLLEEARKIIDNEDNKEIREKIFEDDKIDYEKRKIMEQNLVNYMILKRSENKFNILEEKRKEKKLIII